jgi:Ca2+/Na+ antiporter
MPSHHDTRKPDKDWWDKTKPFVEIVGAVLLLIYTAYTIRMYSANKEAADAAQSAAVTAAKQESTLEVSQRPWIEVVNPSIVQRQTVPPVVPILAGQPLLQEAEYNFSVNVKVYGSTPALRSYGRMNPTFVDLPTSVLPLLQNITPPSLDECARSARWEEGTQAYFPGGTYQVLSNSEIAGTEAVRSLVNMRNALYWVGCIRYEDAFKRRYQTNLCFYWVGLETPIGWRRCHTGNDLIEYAPGEPNVK